LTAIAKPLATSGSKSVVVSPQAPRGSFTVQVAALTRQADALNVASTLMKKKFPAYVVPPQGDKYLPRAGGPLPESKSRRCSAQEHRIRRL